jgi:hypothetical protein
MEDNQFSQAAKMWKEIAEMDEKAMDRKAAIASYEKAADCYKADGHSEVTASQLKIKSADLRLQEGDYDNAIKVYEQV